MEAAGYRCIFMTEKDCGVKGSREGGAVGRRRVRKAEFAQPDVTEVPDGKVNANFGGRDEVEGFKDEERTASVTREFPHEESGAFVRENTGDEEGLGGREESYKAAVSCNLVLHQILGFGEGRIELLGRDQYHLAEVRGSWAGTEGTVTAHDLHAGL